MLPADEEKMRHRILSAHVDEQPPVPGSGVHLVAMFPTGVCVAFIRDALGVARAGRVRQGERERVHLGGGEERVRVRELGGGIHGRVRRVAKKSYVTQNPVEAAQSTQQE